ncbi:MAG: carbohydrate ABC transporter permease [Pseudobutyrivibrio sp.]|nr:carbohydrate ABC transporter permease [Pseudobutyrivibrio sp.]
MNNTKSKKLHISPGMVVVYLLLILWSLTTIFPLVWSVLNSFKNKKMIYSNSFSLPIGDAFSLDNYRNIFANYNILSAYRNSFVISGTVALVVILFAGMAAYVLTRYDFVGKSILNALLYAGMMFPIFSTIIPVLRMQASWGIVNTSSVPVNLLSVILPQIAGNLSFAIIVLSSYIRTLPIELEEAAHMEGCNIFQIFFRIVMPLCRPSFVTVGIFSFLWSYNDLFTQMFFLRTKDNWAITILLNNIASKEGVNYGALFGSVTLIVIPVLIIYLVLNKQIIKGMTVGAVKG